MKQETSIKQPLGKQVLFLVVALISFIFWVVVVVVIRRYLVLGGFLGTLLMALPWIATWALHKQMKKRFLKN